MRQEIEEKIITVFKNYLNSEEVGQKIREIEGSIPEAFNINSIGAIELLILIENEFDIEVDDDELGIDLFNSFDTICDYVEKKLA